MGVSILAVPPYLSGILSESLKVARQGFGWCGLVKNRGQAAEKPGRLDLGYNQLVSMGL